MTKILSLVAMAFLCVQSVPAQNVGIGITTPISKLHIKGTGQLLRLDAPAPSISFFNESVNLGSLFMNETDGSMNLITPSLSGGSIRFSPNNQLNTIFTNTGRVGIGTTTPAEKLDVNGNINLNGVLKFNGSAGGVGQMLVSTGNSAPEWVSAPYNNTTRFAAEIPAETSNGEPLTYQSTYNLNANDVSIGSSSITISKSGLYHFEGYLTYTITFRGDVAKDVAFSAFLHADGETYDLALFSGMHYVGTSQYNTTIHFKNDIYISAPATITLSRSRLYNLSGTAATYESERIRGRISGYLINE